MAHVVQWLFSAGVTVRGELRFEFILRDEEPALCAEK